MKRFELRVHLKGVICTFIISAILLGCSAKTATVVYEVFSPQYYLLKRVDKSDYERLNKLRQSKNARIAASAGVVLGIYYLRYDKDIKRAEPLLADNYNGGALDLYMMRTGELWLMGLEIAKDSASAARAWAEKVRQLKDQGATDEALQTFCTVMRIYPDADEGNISCVDARLGTAAEIEAEAEPEETAAEETLKDALNILITGSADPQDVSGGVYLYAKLNGVNHKTRIAKSYREGDWDFIVDVDNSHLSGRGYAISFKPDAGELLSRLKDFAAFNDCGRMIIGYGSGLREAAYGLSNSLKGRMIVAVTDISGGGANRQIRDYLSDWDQQSFCAVGAGTEDEINNFTPNIRQYVLRPDKQRVYSIITVDTGKHYSGGYLAYYVNTYLFPLVDLTLSPDIVEFAEKYREFSGRELTYETLIGYDMMQYIHMRSSGLDGDETPYLTNIIGFDPDKAIRQSRLLFINSQGKVEFLQLDIDGM